MSTADEVREIFAKMPAAFLPAKAGNTNATILLELTGEGGGNWVVRVANGQVTIQEGAISAPNLTMRMAASDYVAITRGELNPVNAFMAKKISLQGDMTLAMKFPEMFDRGQG